MHVYPGLNMYNGVQVFWQVNATQRFVEIVEPQASKISFVTGAHIHQLRIGAPVIDEGSGTLLPIVASPAVTPIY